MSQPSNPMPDDQHHGDTFSLRAPRGLKGRAVYGARQSNKKLTRWLTEAIEEKCDREGVPTIEEMERLSKTKATSA
jgi:predicted HicB family RNase H-like nuclease